MDEKLASKLDSLFDGDEAAKKTFEQKQKTVTDERTKFVEDFVKVRDEIVKPAFEEIQKRVVGKGWTCEIFTVEPTSSPGGSSPKPALQMYMTRGGSITRSSGRGSPYISFVCDDVGKKAYFMESTIGTNHGGSSGSSGDVQLEQTTPELVQRKAVAYIEKLMNDSKPYYQR